MSGSREKFETSRALVDDTVVATRSTSRPPPRRLRQAHLNIARSAILAPVSGYVARRSVQVGQAQLAPARVLMAVVPLEQVGGSQLPKETQLKHMRLGQEVELRSDLYGGGGVSTRARSTASASAPAARSRCCRRRTPAAAFDQDRAARAGAHRRRSADS